MARSLHDLLEDVTWKGLCVPWAVASAEDLVEARIRLDDVYAAVVMAQAAVKKEIGECGDEF